MFVTDLDDTVYREIDYVYSGYRAIGKILDDEGIMKCDDVVDFLKSSQNTSRVFDDLAARIWLSHPGCRFNVKWMLDVYRYHTPSDLILLPGVVETFEKLKTYGEKIGIITDGRSATQRAKFNALGLEEFVAPQNLIISEETGFDKNNPEPFEIIASRNPEERRFVYIGDNPAKDFRWSNRLGWTTVELKDGFKTNIHSQDIDVPDDYRARYVIDRYDEVIPIWKRTMEMD